MVLVGARVRVIAETPKEDVYRQAVQVATAGLLINLSLGVAKLIGGVVGESFALISDAINSLGDVFTSLAVLFALWIARKPADAEHPYGHTRAEAIAGSNIAVVVFFSALMVGWEAYYRIGVAHSLPPSWTLWIAAANVVIKEVLYHVGMRIGRRSKSSSMLASAWDHRADAFSALAVLVGIAAVRWGGPALIFADELAALAVVLMILVSASSLFYKSASELMDVQADREVVERIRKRAAQVTGVRGVETLWVRKTGLEYLVDIHIEVDPELTVAEGHQIGHNVKDELLESFPVLRDVLVHLEPHLDDTEHLPE